MFDIIQINENEIPSDIIHLKIGDKTKEIYVKASEFNSFIGRGEQFTFAEGKTERIDTSRNGMPGDTSYKLSLYKNGSQIKSIEIAHEDFGSYYNVNSFKITFTEEVSIKKEFPNYIYCKKYNPIQLKPMPKINKLIDSSSFENVSTKLQEINNLLKVSSDNLKTIMDANSLLYEPTDNFSSLVQKLNDEPINFLLEGTKIRSIFGKYLSIYPSAPPAGVEYYHLEFTNIKNDSWIDLKEDLSLKQDGSISLYKESINDGRNNQTTYYIYSENKIYANIDSSYMFNLGLSMIYSINFKNLYVDYVENASHLFENISGNNGDCPLCHMINFLNLRFKNIKNINYMFNHYDLADENHFRIESNNIIDYSNFCENHDWNNGYNYLILDYINDKTKKIAETIVSESNNNVKLGTLVTQ